jgi:hypothetical protein
MKCGPLTLLIGLTARALDALGGGLDEILVGARTGEVGETTPSGAELRGQAGELFTNPSVAVPGTPWRQTIEILTPQEGKALRSWAEATAARPAATMRAEYFIFAS